MPSRNTELTYPWSSGCWHHWGPSQLLQMASQWPWFAALPRSQPITLSRPRDYPCVPHPHLLPPASICSVLEGLNHGRTSALCPSIEAPQGRQVWFGAQRCMGQPSHCVSSFFSRRKGSVSVPQGPGWDLLNSCWCPCPAVTEIQATEPHSSSYHLADQILSLLCPSLHSGPRPLHCFSASTTLPLGSPGLLVPDSPLLSRDLACSWLPECCVASRPASVSLG